MESMKNVVAVQQPLFTRTGYPNLQSTMCIK